MNTQLNLNQTISGAIRLEANGHYTLLTKQQLGDLQLKLSDMQGFDGESFQEYYGCSPEYIQFG